VKDEVRSAEGALGAYRLVPYRNVRCDVAIYQPLEQPDRAISRVACKPLGPKTEAAADQVHHGLGNRDLHCAVGTRALGVDNDPRLVVDQIVRIVGEEGIHARPGHPGCLRIGQRDLLGGLASTTAAAARSAAVSAAALLIAAGSIKGRKVLSNRMGWALGKPIVRMHGTGMLSDLIEGEKHIASEVRKKIPLLFEHYEIPFDEPSCWRQLAVCLALIHVDGFQIVEPAKTRGPRKSWTPQQDKEFVQAIDALRRDGVLTIKEAIKSAERMGTWRWKVSLPSAETRYHEAKRRIAEEGRIIRLLRDHPFEPL